VFLFGGLGDYVVLTLGCYYSVSRRERSWLLVIVLRRLLGERMMYGTWQNKARRGRGLHVVVIARR
jgi:hypothetical protein